MEIENEKSRAHFSFIQTFSLFSRFSIVVEVEYENGKNGLKNSFFFIFISRSY